MKQESLEEVAERLYPINSTGGDMEMLSRHQLNNCSKQEGFIAGAKWQQEQILQFLYSEIIERRPYSSSKMCEVVIEFIEQLNTKK